LTALPAAISGFRGQTPLGLTAISYRGQKPSAARQKILRLIFVKPNILSRINIETNFLGKILKNFTNFVICPKLIANQQPTTDTDNGQK